MQNVTATVIVAEGAVDIYQAKIIVAAVDALIAQRQVLVIVDWSEAQWINPLAIGLLLARRHALLHAGGEIKFCRMAQAVKEIFFKFGVAEFFENYDTLEAAIESFDEQWESGGERRAM